MVNFNFQKFFDSIIKKVFLWMIPYSIKPNYFTYLRIVFVPVIYYLFATDKVVAAFWLFIVAASTDFIDGALARTRNQVTELGKILDPIADKLLILTALYYVGFKYWIVWVISIFIVLEIVAVVFGALFSKYLGRPTGANVFGKIKMWLQCMSVGLFLIGIIFHNEPVIVFSEDILILALFFAVISGLEIARRKLEYLKDKDIITKLP